MDTCTLLTVYWFLAYSRVEIGLFFGSFNPIHTGHLVIANVIKEATDLQQVWFVVSPQSPFKKANTLLNEYDRLRMVELAVEENFDLRACNIEFSLSKPSYTVDTLVHLEERYPQHRFHLLLGSDNLTHFHKWKNYQSILEYRSLYVYPRPDVSEDKIPDIVRNHPHIQRVEAPLLDISATFIRQCLRQNQSIQYLVPDPVIAFIMDKKLYW